MASEDNKFYYLCIEYKYNNVEMIEIIKKYFPNLSDKQMEQFEMLDALYRDWNSKINVISRKDIDNLYEHHVLHSLDRKSVV